MVFQLRNIVLLEHVTFSATIIQSPKVEICNDIFAIRYSLVEAVCLVLEPSSNRANNSLAFLAGLTSDPGTYTMPFLSFFISSFS